MSSGERAKFRSEKLGFVFQVFHLLPYLDVLDNVLTGADPVGPSDSQDRAMELGICVASRVDDIDYVVEAERLGFTHAWFADSQMIWSDVYATMALAAQRTSTIRIGTGVSVAATRPAPVTAASMATINQLAPGRTF